MEGINMQTFFQLLQKKEQTQAYKGDFPFQGEQQIGNVKFNFVQSKQLWNIVINNSKFDSSKILSLYPSFDKLCESNQKQSVCAKLVGNGQLIVECYNCRQDSSCIVCYQCYKNGNHQNHKVIFKKAFGGCCDCGDSEAWKKEGFCKHHSGQVIDSPIQKHIADQFCQIMQDLFYVFYRLKLTHQKMEKAYFTTLIDIAKVIIQKGVKGIKLLSIFFQSCPSLNHLTNLKLQKKPFLHHFVNSKFAASQMREWQNIFINMFPYYQFKKQLIAAYFSCFAEIYEAGLNDGSSLSCQILTSYKLVQNYVQTEGSIPLGHDLLAKITKMEKAQDLSFALCADLCKINSLEGGVPHKYWKFHINYGIENLFIHYECLKREFVNYKEKKCKQQEQLKKKNKKKKQMKDMQLELNQNRPMISFLSNNCNLFQNENCWVALMHETINIIAKDKHLVLQLIQKLYILISQDQEQDFIIFRPYDRVLALALFSYIEKDLSNLQGDEYQQQIRIFLGLNLEDWYTFINKLISRMLSTFMFLSHIVTNETKEYLSNFHAFTYFYQGKDNLLAFIDILQLKMTILLAKKTILIDFDQLMRLNLNASKKWNLNKLTTLMQEIGLSYISKIPEIYVSHYDNNVCALYKDQIMVYLRKYLGSGGGSLGLQKLGQFAGNFLFNNQNTLTSYLRQISIYNKDKKLFELKQPCKDTESLNFHDFTLRTKLTNQAKSAENPKFTTQFITDYNKSIFLSIWNKQNLEKIKYIMTDMHKGLKGQEQQTKDRFTEFFTLICKLTCLLKHSGACEHDVRLIRDLLIQMQIPLQIKKELAFYKDLLGEYVEQDQQHEISKLKEKKDMLQAKKRQKLLKLKSKHQLNLDSAKLMHNQELQRLNSQGQIEQSSQYCVICKNKEEEQHQIVYLAKLSIRDLQKLLKLGKGVKTLSFTTCYHLFHYKCIQNSSVSKTNLQIVFRCPICRKNGNIFFPVNPLADAVKSKPFVSGCLERILQVIMTLRNYQQIDPIEQLIKAFYHYVLLGSFQHQYLLNKRKKLYQIIIKLLSNDYFVKQIAELKCKLKKSAICLRPKMIADSQKTISKVNLQDNEINEELMAADLDSDADEYDEEYLQYLREVLNQQIEQKKKVLNEQKKKKLKQYLLEKRAVKTEKHQETTHIFQYTLRKVLEHVQSITAHTFELLQPQHQEWLWPEVSQEVKIIISQLLGEQCQQDHPFKQLTLSLMEMPQSYNWDMSKNICRECNKVCSDTIVCLLCDWRGCLNCPPGGLTKHIKTVHGQMCPVMRLNDAQGYLIGPGQITKIGCLYANEWGNRFNVKKEWQEYFFQEYIYRQMTATLLRDQ